jgi:hypothetical protein
VFVTQVQFNELDEIVLDMGEVGEQAEVVA